MRSSIRAAPPAQRSDPRRVFPVDDVVLVASRVGRRAVFAAEPGQAQPVAQVDQHILKRPHVSVRLQHRLPDRIGRAVGLANRPVRHTDAIPALQIGRVRQHQVGIRDHLGRKGVRIDNTRDLVFAGFLVLVGQHSHGFGRIHGRVPAHIRHEKEQRIDGIGIAAPSIGNDGLNHAVRRDRKLPRERLVDPAGRTVGLHQKVVWPGWETQGRSRQRPPRSDIRISAGRLKWRRRRLGERWFVTKPAGAIDAAQQHLQQMDRPAGLEAVAVGRDPAHRVNGNRAPDHALMPLPRPIGPRHIERYLLLESDLGQFRRDPPDRRRGYARAVGHSCRRIGRVEVAPRQQLEDRPRPTSVR